MRKISWILTAFLISSCATSSIIKIEELQDDDLELIEYLFSECVGDVPGASAMVIKEGKIVHQESYGLANVDQKIKVTPVTNYRIASVTKQFTAMAIMILIDQGKLEYDTKLTEIFSDFPRYGDNISIRHLLSNQSGLLDYYEFIDEDRSEQYVDSEILAGLMKTDSTNFLSGSRYEYSNTGYTVLAQVVEQVTKTSFADFMKKEIFQKLGMAHTEVFELNEKIENRAYGYSVDKDLIEMNDQSVSSAIQGDGGVYCSIADYYKWDQALYTNQLVPINQIEDAYTDWGGNNKTQEEGYGLGWFVDYQDEMKILSHSGGTAGFDHHMVKIPSLELTVVVFSNRNWTGRHIWYTANALLSIYSDYKIPLSSYVMIKKEIDQKGIENGIQIYNRLKQNSRYETLKTTLSHLGFEYRRTGRLDVAEALFNKSITELPDYFGGYWGLGILYRDTEKIDEAILHFEKALEMGSEDELWIMDRCKEEIAKLKEKKR